MVIYPELYQDARSAKHKRQMGGQMVRQTDGQKGGQTDRQTEGRTEGQTDMTKLIVAFRLTSSKP